MSAAPRTKPEGKRSELLKESLAIVEDALKSIERNDHVTLNELRATHTALDALIKENPSLETDIENGMVVLWERVKVAELLGNIQIADAAQTTDDIETVVINAILVNLRASINHALNPIPRTGETQFNAPTDDTTSPEGNITLDTGTTPTNPDATTAPLPPQNSNPGEESTPESTPEELEAARLAAEEARKEAEVAAKIKAVDDFLRNVLKLKNSDTSPLKKAISGALWAVLNTGGTIDFKELEDFMVDPNSLTLKTKEALEEENEQKVQAVKDLEEEYKSKLSLRNSCEKAKDIPGMKQADDDMKNIREKRNGASKLIKQNEAEIKRLSKVQAAEKRKFLSGADQLDMIHLYFASKDAIKNQTEVDYEDVVEKSHNSLQEAEKEELEAAIEMQSSFFSFLKPKLSDTLKAVGKEAKDLKGVKPEHLATLPDVYEDEDKLKDWLVGIEGTEQYKMQEVLPTLIGYLKTAINIGGKAKIKNNDIKVAGEIILKFKQLEWEYARDKGKEKPGSAIDKMIAYAGIRNTSKAKENKVKADIIAKYADFEGLKNKVNAFWTTAISVGALGSAVAFGPIAAALGTGAFIFGGERFKSLFTKNPEKKKEFKEFGNRVAIASLVGAGGMYALGITTAAPVLAAMAGVGVVTYGILQVKDKLKRFFGKAAMLITGNAAEDNASVQNALKT